MTNNKDNLHDTTDKDVLIDRKRLSEITGFAISTIRSYDYTKRYDFRPIKPAKGRGGKVKYRLSHIRRLVEQWELSPE